MKDYTKNNQDVDHNVVDYNIENLSLYELEYMEANVYEY